METAILLNRGGGSATDRSRVEEALQRAGIAATGRWLEGSEIAQAARDAVNAGARLVIAGGGDGTISAAAGALCGTDVALGILPLGTLNHFARDLGIPLDIDEAAKLITSGARRKVDVAEVNGRVFVNNSSIGVYPLLVRERDAQRRQLGRGKALAMAIAAARTLIRFSKNRLNVTIGDREASVETPLLFVGNNRYRLRMPRAGTREQLDGGELCVLVLRRKSLPGFAAAALRAVLGRERRQDVARIDDVRDLQVDSARSALTVSLDGETALMKTPLRYVARPQALTVIAS